MNITTIMTDLYVARADVFLALSALLLLALGVFIKKHAFQTIASLGLIVFAVSISMILQQDNSESPITLFGDMLVYDRFGVFMKVLVIIGSMSAIVMGVRDLGGQVIGKFEYVILVLLATLGMNIMISANNMLSLYIGLELQSLALYILAAFNRNSLSSSEAGLKYFILGALSSGMLLFGVSLVYGYTGTTSFPLIADIILVQQTDMVSMGILVGLVFVLVGLAFKISAVPFHMWTPDVYQGSPSAVTAFFAMAPKMAAMALIARILFSTFGELHNEWMQIIAVLSVASMVVGAFAGLVQNNLYRLLAYSSIGHMGYAMLGYFVGGFDGVTATLVYLSIYLVMTAGTFACILSVRNKDNMAAMALSDFSGLSKKSPAVSYGLAILMFSMAGIPPLAGFFGKFYIFKTVLEGGHYALAVVGVLTSVVAAYYYLRLIKIMFFDEPSKEYDVQKSNVLRWVGLPSILFVVLFIFAPDRLVYEATQAALSLR